MRGKLIIAVMALGFVAVSCGESAEVKEQKEAQLKIAKELNGKLDALTVEIEAIDLAEEEIEVAISELDKI
jgi:hypothetical protein